jgi:hypothetical protein
MKRLLLALTAAILQACGRTPPPAPLSAPPVAVSHPLAREVETVSREAVAARAAGAAYVNSPNSTADRIQRVTELTLAMRDTVDRMRGRETTENVGAARRAVLALTAYLN